MSTTGKRRVPRRVAIIGSRGSSRGSHLVGDRRSLGAPIPEPGPCPPFDQAGPEPTSSIPASQLQWAIGIYAGTSPLQLSAPATIRNPVISRNDVSDARAQFVADPFMVCRDGRWYMFFEVMNRDSDRGEIGLALSDDGMHWKYSRIVLEEPFHLSYPHVFEWHDDYYMIPETLGAGSVSLYHATRFPTDWTRIAPLLPVKCADPTIFRSDGMFWMFGCVPVRTSDTLRLYYAADLMTSWQEHPRSPIVEGDARIARPAGRVTWWDDRMIRFAQDCHIRYGDRVRAFEILELTPTTYREREVEESPVLCATGHGRNSQSWNRQKMHHVDPHLITDGRWIACVDGC